ncbi:hypothetical protein V6N11_036470 [Hibiscus sabdariffa]|uniref:Uncharacterized protein n=1 Tax=Hibiscus sabdariffa TaxID=183260 RepID=A0ABR2RAS5_9ROSI
MGDGLGNWLWDKFQHLLPLPFLLRITENNEPFLTAAMVGVNEGLWREIHKFCGLQRVKNKAASILENSRRLTLTCCSTAAVIGTTNGYGSSAGIRVQGCERVGAANVVANTGLHTDKRLLRPEVGWIKLNTDDHLYRYASSMDFEVHILENPTDELDELLLDDEGC